MLADSSLDKEFRDMASEEAAEAQKKTEELKEELKVLLLPKDPNDYKNVIVEIRGGAGGEEAALFAGSLFRMYSMYAERKGWKTEIMNENPTELGGYKEISFMIEARALIRGSNLRAAFTAFSACQKPRARAEFTRLP